MDKLKWNEKNVQIMQKKARNRNRITKKNQNEHTYNNKIVNINASISITALNVNGLHTSIKRQSLKIH